MGQKRLSENGVEGLAESLGFARAVGPEKSRVTSRKGSVPFFDWSQLA